MNATMTRDEALEVLRDLMPDAISIHDLSVDDDEYWTATVETAHDGRVGVAFPDWHPAAFSICQGGRTLR